MTNSDLVNIYMAVEDERGRIVPVLRSAWGIEADAVAYAATKPEVKGIIVVNVRTNERTFKPKAADPTCMRCAGPFDARTGRHRRNSLVKC